MRFLLKLLCLLTFVNVATAQTADRWQQRAEYKMTIDMDVEKHQFTGKQTIKYFNNSPDDLDKVFYHLYLNAFQPNSMMDVRSRTIRDPDSRVGERISKLKEHEIGYHKINSLTQDGEPTTYEVVGTILEVKLAKPIKAGETTILEMEFNSQVPNQIRRTGRNNKEGIDYSMSQWYPKLCEYDYQGWHSNPYIGREFHGIWGDFDVTINIDKNYVVGGSGYLQNPQEVGYGYEDPSKKVNRPKGDKLSWHFIAPNVHDFMWAADPDYKHTTMQVPDGPLLHFFYQPGDKTKNWEELPALTVKAFQYISENFGKYPYKQYSVIQGGDGGMEYPMATLITGHRGLSSLLGVTVHEALHSWFQMILGTNESLYAWMDEGFTTYATNLTKSHVEGKTGNVQKGSYSGYFNLVRSGVEEPMTTHADHFQTNYGYGQAAYNKGAVFLYQLQYIIGEEAFKKGMLSYYNTWKFRHPNPNDFIRIMEKESGLELDWYKEYWVYTTNVIDYRVKDVKAKGKKEVTIELDRLGTMPMPLDVVVEYTNGKKEVYNIPLQIMRGEKPAENMGEKTTWNTAEDWAWTHPEYTLTIPAKLKKVAKITIDPSERMADVERSNNTFEVKKD